ncbi:AAA family ATPase [Microvirga splendida]|uniref:AAA family ATPase n=1 Tax=Microvirga splendida TaxID=2795727 RepID=A0ABS0Y0Q9_9HYPH|nr:AAA family ATPase [Microvirga splendida]MBJ6125540.1 AAA family ATPase [Microvirga splendida]
MAEADDITLDDLLVPAEDNAEASAPEPYTSPFTPAAQTLARYALEAALDRRTRRRFTAAPTLAAVIAVPTPAWVEPMYLAARTLASWDGVAIRTGTDRVHHQPAKGNEHAMDYLSRSRRFLGIAPDPGRHLPSALMGAADLQITIPHPSPAVLRRVIRAATGSVPRRVPPDLGVALDFADICSAIRIRTTPASCVRRLQAAARARTMVDATVAEAPALSALHGFGEAMTWAEALVQDLEAWRRGALDFSAIDRACVWAGPPGTGKTTLARSIAKAADLPLVSTSVGGWFSQGTGYLDVTIREWEKALAAATALSRPALLFIDELDALPDRATVDGRNRDYWSVLVTKILLDIERVLSNPSSRVVIVGATNHPGRIDAALVRPGRLNRVIEIPIPDPAALAKILRYHLGEHDLPGADLGPLARIAAGATGADAALWVKSARRRARMAGRAMALHDLIAEILPPDTRSPKALRHCAVHEAGHAVALHLVGAGTVAEISLLDRHGGGFMNGLAPAEPVLSRPALEAMVIVLLAGRAAEKVICGAATTGAGGAPRSDLALATGWLAAVHASLGLGDSLAYRAAPENAASLLALDPDLRRAVEGDLNRLHACAEALVREHRPLVEAVAGVLEADRYMDGQDFLRLFTAYARAATARRPRRKGGRHG